MSNLFLSGRDEFKSCFSMFDGRHQNKLFMDQGISVTCDDIRHTGSRKKPVCLRSYKHGYHSRHLGKTVG